MAVSQQADMSSRSPAAETHEHLQDPQTKLPLNTPFQSQQSLAPQSQGTAGSGPLSSNASKGLNIEDLPEDKSSMDSFEEDAYAVNIFVGLGVLGITSAIAPFYVSSSSIAACLLVGISFVVRATQAETRGRVFMEARPRPRPSTRHLPAVYFLYVMGSGGHTAEMSEMIRRKFRGQRNTHRRYVSTTGDEHSAASIAMTETLIKDAYIDGNGGTWDHFQVKRARAVHQPLYTAWFTSIWSALNIVNALSREPNQRPYDKYGQLYKYPHVVITNGPGTGFILCLVAHLLKIFYLVPQNRLKLVYVESWAHTRTLSLTGKLFHWTSIADLFCVQHRDLAEKFGKHYVGLVTERTTPVG
ncbi:UDP-N-acetylglucosamine transferase subunit ALG14 [Phialemonium atrogriseum]|uniref:UDP-N-acetylglucosamine transferase subunit ALG14 n=1 Tax=Phialemonium atrogriseum TaxID=1093897 RepID=A0AAJ0C9A3_9PEZI|nr:UDP-N-acetylglucosamine transferase subunit ALG14 [Phialemonium atrogriseum]KAK1772330.1 UDP-N-acetylglucosamine transferase subunit ALG14 [Phialemonium atrogriseum]